MSTILKLSEASSLAFHAMALLARHSEARISATKMAELFHASEHTLAKVMNGLVRAHFVDSVRGASGGFLLVRDPQKITLLDIYEAIDGSLREQHCLLGKPACDGEHCPMQGLMEKLHQELHGYFSRTTLDAFARSLRLTGVFPNDTTSGKRTKAREV